LLLHLRSRPTLKGITAASRAALTPPWPDLVISAGRRNELVAQWIRTQAPAVRLVHIGRPWCHPARFDLVIATPQYRLDDFPNVQINALPLIQVDETRIAAASLRFRDQFAELPGPRTVLLLGGNSGGYVLDEHQAAALATRLSGFAGGGSLLISSSRRTPRRFLEALLGRLEGVEFVYRWDDAGENPYPGLLAWADRFVVTEDSVSMTAEALVTGKPVFVVPIDSAAPEDGSRWWLRMNNFGWKPLTHRLAMRYAPRRFYRDVRRLHFSLVAAGLIRWLGGPPSRLTQEAAPSSEAESAALPGGAGRQLQQQDLARSVARVTALFSAAELSQLQTQPAQAPRGSAVISGPPQS